MKQSNHRGFTLIGLVIVIIILGILGAVAVPKFISLQRDAKIAALKETKSEMLTAFRDFSLKAKTSHETYKKNGLTYLDVNGQPIRVNPLDDYPHFDFNPTVIAKEMAALIDLDKNYQITKHGDGIYIFPKGSDPLENCKLEYINGITHVSLYAPKKSDIRIYTSDC